MVMCQRHLICHRKGPAGLTSRSHPLVINVFRQAESLGNLGQEPQSVFMTLSSKKVPEPINLYQRIGYGRLDMYPLNPLKDGREMKELADNWKKSSFEGFFGTEKVHSVPLSSATSIAVLLVWYPADKQKGVKKILLLGSCPPEKVFAALEKMKTLLFLKPSPVAKSRKQATKPTVVVPTAAPVPSKEIPMEEPEGGAKMSKSPPPPPDVTRVPPAANEPIVPVAASLKGIVEAMGALALDAPEQRREVSPPHPYEPPEDIPPSPLPAVGMVDSSVETTGMCAHA